MSQASGMDLVQFIKLVGAERVQAALGQIINKEEELDSKRKIGNQTARQGNDILETSVRKVLAFIAAWAGFGQVLSWINNYKQALAEVINLLKEFSDSAADTQEKVQLLAIQMGDASEKGLNKAMFRAADVARSGGVPLGMGAEILQSVASTFPTSGEDFQLGLAKEVSTLAGVNKIAPGSVGAIVELLKASNKSSLAESKDLLAQVDAAMKASPALEFGSFGKATIKGGAGLLALGATDREVLRYMVGARAVSGGSDDVAGETLKMLGYSMSSAGMQRHFRSIGIDNAPIQAKFGEMERMFADPKRGNKEAREFLRSEQLMRMTMLFSAGAKSQMADFDTMSAQFTPEKYAAEAAAFKDSKIGLRNRIGLELELQRGIQSTEQFKKGLMAGVVDEQMKRLKIESPEAFVNLGAETALRDEMKKHVDRLFGGPLQGTTLPTEEHPILTTARDVSAAEESAGGFFLEAFGIKGRSSPERAEQARKHYAMREALKQGPQVVVQNYVENQVVPRQDITQQPSEARNAKPGGQN